MIKTYIKIAIRNLIKYKGYSFINIFGLTLGLTTSVLIFLFVQDEKSYDRMHDDSELIFRVERFSSYNDNDSRWAPRAGFLLSELTKRYPEIQSGARLRTGRLETFSFENNYYNEGDFLYADSTFFNVFSFDVLSGNPQTALDSPDKIVLTKSTAVKYFGNIDPIGKIIKRGTQPFTVTAVMQDVPHNSHFHFDFLLPMADLRRQSRELVDGKLALQFYTYIKINSIDGVKSLQGKLDKDVFDINNVTNEKGEIGPPEGYIRREVLMPLADIHLYGHAEKEMEANGNAQYIYIFSTVAIFILIIASFNYMNLATARSVKKAKEVGMRKVLGAERHQIFFQFIGESFFFTFIAICAALLAVVLTIPAFNDFTGKELPVNIFMNTELMIGLLIIYFSVSTLAGFYPSLFLSNFGPLKALKSNVLSGKGNSSVQYLRRGLVILQFGISIFLIVGAHTIYKQLKYIENKDLGFGKEQVLVVNLPRNRTAENIEAIKQQLLTNSNVVATAASSSIPGRRYGRYGVRIPDLAVEDAGNQNEQQDNGARGMRVMFADEDISEVLGFEIIQGRDLSKDMATDATGGFLLNEAAIKTFGLEENPIGRRFEYTYGLPEPKTGHIIGVVKDFHYASLHSEVEPVAIHVFPQYVSYLLVRITANNVNETLDDVEKAWASIMPAAPFDHFFLDNFYDNLYRTEMTMGSVITFFTLLAVVIACMGLFGLASFITEQRKKEIGVRKVLGASIQSIMVSLSKEFILLILITNILAAYPAYYYLNNWLGGFAFRIDMSAITFLVAGVVALSIALLTISLKTYQASRANPIQSLRYE